MPVRRHWRRCRRSPIAGTVCRMPGNSALWKTISHCTRLSLEKKEDALTGICRRRLGLRGRPLAERYGDGHSMSNNRRGSKGVTSHQPIF